jgi:hypothetical protein
MSAALDSREFAAMESRFSEAVESVLVERPVYM